jgi:CHAT domain-containing protein
MKEAYSILKDNLKKNSGYLSETELNQFVETLFYNLESYQSFNYQQSVSKVENGGFSLDIELYRKGLQLKSLIETRKHIETSGDTSLIHSFHTMLALRKQADRLYTLPPEKRQDDPSKLEIKANEMEKELKKRSVEYSQSLDEAEITWKQVQEKLKPDEAVVEFASFGYYNKKWTDSTLYCALVLRKHDIAPRLFYLFEEKQLAEVLAITKKSSDASINNMYALFRGSALLIDSSWYSGEKLYNLVWKPLDDYLSGIKTVNFACSGLLNSVSFAAIPDTTGKLLSEKYALNQYSSARNLAFETIELPIADATIYGGIQYDLDTTLMIANAGKYSKSNDFTLAYHSARSANTRGDGFDVLEGTREEANAINELFRENRISTHNFTVAAANEESFKAMAGKKSPSVIHLSTHGFYYPDIATQLKNANDLLFTGSDLNRFQYSPDPLLRSGIVLAGANRAWRGEPLPAGVEDGILTAKEVSQLNLNNTQLVVLSACQTGLGDVKGSEGVFGLQRAFKMAGVKYLIMSLWSVPDKETKEFMEKFYTHWLSGTPIRQAFQATQQEMRSEYPKEPYKWAAFVLVE